MRDHRGHTGHVPREAAARGDVSWSLAPAAARARSRPSNPPLAHPQPGGMPVPIPATRTVDDERPPMRTVSRSATAAHGTHIGAVSEMFVGDSHQRPVDLPTVRAMAGDRRLAGGLDVSGRGPHRSPRYIRVDGEHRCVPARSLTPPPTPVATIHDGDTIAEAANLFDRINRERRLSCWDHRRAPKADDITVRCIETISARGLVVDPSAADGHLGCAAILGKIVRVGGLGQCRSARRAG
jgi:hypothetical protein